ncbi:MAG: hypothetical protein KatS3mg027_0838 [Bacteroidia bacterium]|nr:MAG: hypothetical protein KatS3mg027_0838 [Bacteroidia bacterium]
MKKSLLLIFTLLFCFNFFAQDVNVLIQKLPALNGKEKISTLMDICFLYAPNNPKLAVSYGQQGLQLAYKTKDSLLIASCMNDLSIAYYYHALYDSCVYYAERSYHIRKKYGKLKEAAASISKSALAYYEEGNYSEALKKHELALDLFLKEKYLEGYAKTLSNIASIYEKTGKLEYAKKLNKICADTCLKYNNQDGYLNAMGNIALILQKQDSLDHALKLFLSIENIAKKINNNHYLSSVYQNMGVLHLKLNNISQAMNYFNKVLSINDTTEQLDIVALATINLGTCYQKLNQYNEAKKFILQGIKYSKKSKNLAYEKFGYLKMYELCKLEKNYNEALEYYEQYQKLNDTLKTQEYQKSLAHFDARYKNILFQNKIITQQNAILNYENRINNQQFWIVLLSSSIFILTLLTFVIVLYQNNKQKRKELFYLKKIQDEKERISKDLHDNLGAELTLVTMLIDSEAQQSKQNNEGLLDIANKIRYAISLMRDTIWATSGEQRTLYELGIKIKEFAEKLASPKNIKINYSINGDDIELNPDKILNLYRISQEIINNSVKHSDTKNINIQIAHDEQVSISISDEGKGFDIDTVKKNYGLNNIFNRASSIDAKILYDSVLGKGTNYTIIV